MSVCGADLLALGAELSAGEAEVYWRASVGRSYYAAYHCASQWHESLPSQGLATSGQGVHATLIECLIKPTVTGAPAMKSRSVGYMLRVLKAARTRADYELSGSIDAAEAWSHHAQAQVLLDKLARAPTG